MFHIVPSPSSLQLTAPSDLSLDHLTKFNTNIEPISMRNYIVLGTFLILFQLYGDQWIPEAPKLNELDFKLF